MQPKKDVDHMAMPCWPGAMLIMIHSQLAFSFFEALLDGPPHNGGIAHLRQRHIQGCIGEEKLVLPSGVVRIKSHPEPSWDRPPLAG